MLISLAQLAVWTLDRGATDELAGLDVGNRRRPGAHNAQVGGQCKRQLFSGICFNRQLLTLKLFDGRTGAQHLGELPDLGRMPVQPGLSRKQ
jgi:hypothetical protein